MATDPSSKPPIALATCAEWPRLWDDDQVLAGALRAQGHDVRTPVWTDESVAWAAFPLVVVRSTWDYWTQREAYLAWTRRVAEVTTLLNPAPVVEWNTHKGYLRELAGRGLPVVPTMWVERGGTVDLAAAAAERGWADVVAKPAVSAGAEDTLRLSDVGIEALQELADRVLTVKDLMVQPYLSAVETVGERSTIWIDGELSHGVRRPPYLSAGRFADSELADPPADEVALGQQVLAACPPGLLYARVDSVRDPERGLLLMEVELVEPQLFFRLSPAAAERMCRAIEARLP